MRTELKRIRAVQVGYRQALSPERSALVGAGFIINKPSGNSIRHRKLLENNYLVMFILRGNGTYHDPQNGEFPVRAGNAIIAFPELPHSYHPTDTWDEAYLAMSGRAFRLLEDEGVLARTSPVISPGLTPALVASVKSMVEDFLAERTPPDSILTARVHMLLAQMCEAHRANSSVGTKDEFLRRACAILEARLSEELDLQEVSRQFNFGYERFRKLFTEQAGVSPARYRILRRIDRAKTLLMENRTPLKSIAEQLGYCDVYFFTRQFKQVTGMNPGEFRRF